MNSNIIKEINNEYEKKRIKAYNELIQRKEDIYSKIPKLKEIDNEINSYAIKSSKYILLAESSEKDTYIQELEKKIEELKNEKNKLLKNANISENKLEIEYECTICNDTGYVNNEKCSCYKQKLLNISYDNSNLKNFSNHTFENFNIEYYSDEKDESLNISPRQNILNIMKISEKFIENFNEPNQKNLLFTGYTGLGKTYMSSCIANELLKQGKTVLYQTAPILMDTLIDYKFKKTLDSEKTYKDVFNVDLLIIDDLGVEALNSLKYSELFTIINTRLLNTDKVTKTIISTNLSIEDMFKTYEERTMSRIIGNYSICKFIGDDIRIKTR
ncbi:MAG: DNA replication protein DnaC [Clostridiales bacterium]|nr:DNA replication protein DnaC [Clostridiales bacterium]